MTASPVPRQETHWRHTQRVVRFGPVDYRAAFLLVLLVMHCRWWTLYTALAGFVILGILEWMGLPVPVAVVRFRRLCASHLFGHLRWSR